MTLENAYLKHILIFLDSDDPDTTLLVTLMNSWYAHHQGHPFLSSNGKPLWLSTKKNKPLLANHVHAISAAAKEAMSKGKYEELIIDHSVPSSVLASAIRQSHAKGHIFDIEDVQNFLKPRFTLALLTKTEHDKDLRPWKSSMIKGWSDDQCVSDPTSRFCRYGPAGANIDFEVLDQPR